MAEDNVVIVLKEQLTKEMIEAGAQLTAKLDEMGIPLAAALWLFSPEINEWRLVFATPEVSTAGPRTVYGKIDQARQALGELDAAIPMFGVDLLDPNNELIRALRSTVQTGSGVSRLRFSKNVANGRYIEDALIYRVA
jgi:hypothetical protein